MPFIASMEIMEGIKGICSRTLERLKIWTQKISFKSILKQTWFLIGLSFIIVLAYLLRDYGNDKVIANATLSQSLVMLIFFNNGLVLSVGELLKSVRNWKMILLSQTFIFIITPVLMYGMVWILLLSDNITVVLATGLMVLGSLPTTISSCVVYTDMAKGNTEGSLLNACLSNTLSVVLSPFLVSIFKFSNNAKYPSVLDDIDQAKTVFLNLLYEIVIPLIVGLIVRFLLSKFSRFRSDWVEKYKKIATPLSSVFLLINIFLVFCSTFNKNSARDASGLRDFFVLLLFLPLMHAVYILSSFFVSGIKKFGFSHSDRVSIVFVASQKTIAIAIPLITRMYGNDKDAGTIVLPILVYHPLQMFFAAFLAGRLKSFVKTENIRIDNTGFVLIENENGEETMTNENGIPLKVFHTDEKKDTQIEIINNENENENESENEQSVLMSNIVDSEKENSLVLGDIVVKDETVT